MNDDCSYNDRKFNSVIMASAGFDWLAIDLEHMYRFGNYANFNSSNPSKKR